MGETITLPAGTYESTLQQPEGRVLLASLSYGGGEIVVIVRAEFLIVASEIFHGLLPLPLIFGSTTQAKK
jgi:hypothetical protein